MLDLGLSQKTFRPEKDAGVVFNCGAKVSALVWGGKSLLRQKLGVIAEVIGFIFDANPLVLLDAHYLKLIATVLCCALMAYAKYPSPDEYREIKNESRNAIDE